jgi:outer membrane receptor protein involved in Fe transport
MNLRHSFWLFLLSGTTAAAAESGPPNPVGDSPHAGPNVMPPHLESAAPDRGTSAASWRSELDDLSLARMLSVKVTAASRTPEAAEDAPASMTVFTREQILRMGVSTLEDLLNYVPGFQSTSDAVFGRMGRISVRGLFSTVSSGILLLHDGIPDWNAYDGSAWAFGRHAMLNGVERVEVVRGPGSTMWGANASSAVINVVSVTDRDTVSAGYGTIGRRELSVNFHREVLPGLKLSGSVQGYADDGFTFNNYTDAFGVTSSIKDPMSQYAAMLRGEYKGLTLTIRDSGTWWREFVNWAAASPANANSIDRYSADLAYRRGFGRDGNVTFGLTYSNDRFDSFALTVPQGIALIPGQPLAHDWLAGPFVSTPVVRLRADATWTPIAHNTVNVGFAGAYGWMARAGHLSGYDPETLADYRSTRTLTGNLNFVDEHGWEMLLGLYAQDTHRVGPFALTAGARIDYTLISAQLPGPFDRRQSWYLPILPRVALTYKTPIASTVKLMYGRAFRAPSITELTIAHNPVITGGLATNASLRPELVDTGELAYIQNLFARLSVTGTGYVSYAHNLITPGQALTPADACFPVCTPGSTALGNNGQLLTSGLELELKANPVTDLLLVGSYDHLFGAWKDGDRVEVEQGANAFAADVAYSIRGATIDVSGFFRQHASVVPTQGNYLVLSSRISYRIARRLKASASAENILDERYIGQTSYNLPQGAPARGRTVYFALAYE